MRRDERTFESMQNKNVPHRVAISAVAIAFISIGLVEWRALYALDHPPLRHVDCVSCHSDAKTLAAIADKAGDPLYLVKRGDLPLHTNSALRK